jgi:hypothetical protein
MNNIKKFVDFVNESTVTEKKDSKVFITRRGEKVELISLTSVQSFVDPKGMVYRQLPNGKPDTEGESSTAFLYDKEWQDALSKEDRKILSKLDMSPFVNRYK